MSSNKAPNESWEEFYQHHVTPNNISSPMTRGMITENTSVVSASPGHVSRPIRRRQRASRRNPTTVLNTDPTNFRAMVQQFTGGYVNTTSPYPVSMGSSLYSNPREIPNSIDFRARDGVRQHNVPSEPSYHQFLQLQQQQQRQGGQDSNDAFLAHMIRDSGADEENSKTFGC